MCRIWGLFLHPKTRTAKTLTKSTVPFRVEKIVLGQFSVRYLTYLLPRKPIGFRA